MLELGAGTGKLTGVLLSAGHEVLATEPDPAMVDPLVVAHPGVTAARAGAEQIPAATRSVDAVVAAQALHCFDLDAALPEMARVLRPGGTLGLVWNIMDTRIPWVRRLRTLMDAAEPPTEAVAAVEASGLFAPFEAETFRFWQPLDRESLAALVSSVSAVAVRDEAGRAEVLAAADALYDEYGRGHDGMLLPYVTYAYRSTVLAGAECETDGPVAVDRDDVDTDSLLIDFR